MEPPRLDRVVGGLKVNYLSASSSSFLVSYWLKFVPLHFLVMSPCPLGSSGEIKDSRGPGGLDLGSRATEAPDTTDVMKSLMKPDPYPWRVSQQCQGMRQYSDSRAL